MGDAVTNQPAGPGRPASPADRLAEDVAEVVRAEVRAVRGQLADAARPAGLGFALLAAAGGCLVLGAGAASTTVLRMLETFLPRRLAAAGLTAGYLAVAVVLGRVGLARLRAAGGSSARLADEVRDAVSATAGRVVPAGSAAARDALGR
ncbi:phage holin family protein [Micromonospora narathiwatensis]|uniref:Putative Holin-X, holin superfamily III n=1 Tax=Micromonospora narathiwatensis TaxID=299146 RepID=A0A1A8ZP44_9ACTN|nr:phage holin family protein [Micromonospora narathiwatensis]SBT45878.1 Putative Holin-X, holin superfamily III [Micromonospora narathiwatensis]